MYSLVLVPGNKLTLEKESRSLHFSVTYVYYIYMFW